jgi:DNA polymerase-4
VTSEKLRARGIGTVGEVALLGEAVLVALLGRASGRHLHALAHNRDPRPVQVGRRRGSIGSQRALGRGYKSRREVDAYLAGLVDRVTRRLRTADRTCRTLVLRLRFDDFGRATRSHTLPRATASTPVVLAAARGLLEESWPFIEPRGLTLIGIALANLDDDAVLQLALPFERAGAGPLDAALDDVRDRFGSSSVTRAALLGREPDFTVPMLPD